MLWTNRSWCRRQCNLATEHTHCAVHVQVVKRGAVPADVTTVQVHMATAFLPLYCVATHTHTHTHFCSYKLVEQFTMLNWANLPLPPATPAHLPKQQQQQQTKTHTHDFPTQNHVTRHFILEPAGYRISNNTGLVNHKSHTRVKQNRFPVHPTVCQCQMGIRAKHVAYGIYPAT